RSILVGFVIFLSYEAFSQPLEMHKTFGGAYFKRDTLYLTTRQLRDILSVDQQASQEFNTAVNNSRAGTLLGFGGAILIAIPVISAIAGGDPEWTIAGAGAVFIGASIPFSRGYKRHAQAAIDGYNQRQQKQSRATFYFTGNGLTLKF
ncbi:MAG TPA: hypothetical protein VF473_06080, partial [Cyclobacteriaceae bacterium]